MPVLLGFLALFWVFSPAWAACTDLTEGLSVSVAGVIDGSTLALHDGAQLRLAGVLVPHADDARAAAQAWPPAVAAKAEVEALVLGKTIAVAFGRERADRYGRHLGHVSVDEASGRRWLQGHLLEQGLARAVTRADDRACEAAMLAAERIAREAQRGIWTHAAYRIRQAQDVNAFSALIGSFQIVEGRITASRRSGSGVRLDFASDGRFGLVALLPRDAAARGRTLVKDTRVRLRGWLEERGGRPTLDLAVAGTLELLDEGIGDGTAMEYR
jgi:micrococcal nuclease